MMTAFILTLMLPLLPAPAQDSPEATVDAFHAAVSGDEREAALALLAEDVVIFEAGGAEMSRDEYAAHHLEGDMKFADATERTVTDRRSESQGEVAWVLSRTETHGSFGEREIHSRGTETMLLRATKEGWRIIHIHWSSGRIRNP